MSYSQVSFPNFLEDRDCKNLIQLMLNKNKAGRFYKFEQISSHVWFKDFKWEELLSLNLEPEYLPDLQKDKDKEKLEFEERPYLDYINEGNINDEQKSHKHKISDEEKKEFDEWIKNF